VKVRISFDQLDPRILPDMGVKVAFLAQAGAQSPAGAARTLVPQAALREADGRTVVLVVRDDRLERRAVTVGGTTSGDTEVLAGLAEGEAVVVAGPAVLRDGQRVRIRE
jgi:hypothetical protein